MPCAPPPSRGAPMSWTARSSGRSWWTSRPLLDQVRLHRHVVRRRAVEGALLLRPHADKLAVLHLLEHEAAARHLAADIRLADEAVGVEARHVLQRAEEV